MSAFNGAVTAREQVAEATWAFRIEVEGGFEYEAGQSIDLTLLSPVHHDDAGVTRAFSIASAPERRPLTIASRVRGSAFKRDLLESPLGIPVRVEGPFGSMTLPADPGTVLMFAGGIGVTPFRAMVERAVARDLPHRLLLVHSNRVPAEAPFLEEFAALARAHERFRYVPTMTAADRAPGWTGERRRVDAEWIAQLAPAERATARYYAAGPDRFVEAMAHALQSLGIPGERIAFELFTGY